MNVYADGDGNRVVELTIDVPVFDSRGDREYGQLAFAVSDPGHEGRHGRRLLL